MHSSNSYLTQFTAEATTSDFRALAKLIEQGKIKIHMDNKRYSYEGIPVVIAYIEQMRTREKVVWSGGTG